jgi:3-deoxy-D-manno-octulosonic-acid transferase
MRAIYSLVLMLLSPLVLLRLWWRGFKAPEYRRRWGERFGFVSAVDDRPLWIHAVSVGETVAAAPLIKALLQQHGDISLLVTTTTPTGSAQLRRLFGDRVLHVYMPYDLPGAVKRFLGRVRPRQLLAMETEIWPNLFHHCARRHIPVIVANARLSQRSADGYRRVAGLTRATLNNTTMIAAQSESDAVRFIGLGAQPERVQVTGSIKFDIKLPASVSEQGEVLRRGVLGLNRPVWIAASTHTGEDEQVLAAFAEVRRSVHDALLLLVPRHPERFDEVSRLCQRRGFEVVRRSEQRPCNETTGVFVGDTMGELTMFYAASDLCFMGGSLVAVGGHNLLEPAALGRAVLFGPQMFNFAEISAMFLEAGAARRIDDSAALARTVIELLQDANLRDDIGRKGKQLVEENRGALEKLLAIVEAALKPQL